MFERSKRVDGVRGRGALTFGAVGVVCAGLIAGPMSPVWAAEGAEGAAAVELGSLALGDGLEGMLGEADGSVRFEVPLGGLNLSWDSRLAGVNRYGFGDRWGIAVASVEIDGGVLVRPSSGGVFEMNASHPSGLAGYAGGDVVFRAAPEGALLEGRADGVVGPRAYAYELHELGGERTYFNADGDPIATMLTTGDRRDWVWAEGEQSRLVEVVSVEGVATALEWSDSEVTIRPGSNVTAAAPGSGVGGVWRVGLRDGAVSTVTDPVGQVTRVTYDDQGLVTSIGAASGAVTSVTWETANDAVPRVSVLRVLSREGVELSRREWRATGSGVSGWPLRDAAGAVGPEFSTVVSDGATRIESTFDSWRLMTDRKVVTAGAAGEVVAQEQQFEFPDRGDVTDPATVPAHWMKPSEVSITYRDASGAERTGSESYVFDEFGRMVRRAAADGTVTERTYDSTQPAPGMPAIGLPTSETVTAPDGLVAVTEYGLSDDRRAVTSVRTSSGRPGAALQVTGLTEYTVEGARVTEQRVYPGGDAGAAPLVTTFDEAIDLAAGTLAATKTVAAGTPVEMTSSSVASLVHGGALETTDAAGITSIATYDQVGRSVTVDDGTGQVTQSKHRTLEVDGVNAVTVTGPDGVSVTAETDELGRLLRAYDDIAPDGEQRSGYQRVFETRAYPEPGVEESTDAWGATTRTELDVHGRPLKVTLPNGLVQASEHDDVAMTATAWTSPTGSRADAEQTVTRRFDEAGRTVQMTGSRADGVPVPEVSTVYDGFGREVGVDDGVTVSQVEFDAAGNPVRTTTAAAEGAAGSEGSPDTAAAATAGASGLTPSEPLVAERRFDGFGVSLEKTLSAGEESRSGGRRELDVLGRTVAEIDQAGDAERVEYTPDGLVARTVADTGRETVHTYDDTRALVASRTTSPTGAAVETAYAYDPSTRRLTAVWDPADPERTRIAYEYDAFGNVTLVQYPSEQPGVAGKQVRHLYDEHGRELATIDVAGRRTDLSYDEHGFLTGAVQRDSDDELARVAYTYDAHGRIAEIARGNGVTTTIGYTSTHAIASEATTRGDVVQTERRYEYDPASGDLTSRIDRVRVDGELVPTRTDYRYDALGRLTASAVRLSDAADAPVASETAYELTVSGRVAAETVTTDPGTERSASTRRQLEYSPVGELETVTTTHPDGRVEIGSQIWDAAGNLVQALDGTTFEWDAANRRIGENRADGTRIETAYWADGSRAKVSTEAGATRFYWDGTTLLNDVHSVAGGASAQPAGEQTGGVASYLIGVSRHGRITDPAHGTRVDGAGADGADTAVAYYGTDRHGNVTDLTDATGQTTTRYAYTDYGVPTTTAAPAPSIHETALPAGIGELERNPFQYAAEYTHDDGTQFLRERVLDPAVFGFQSKDRASLHDLFGYANANPIMLIDPSGRDAVVDWSGVATAAWGAAAALGSVLALTIASAPLGPFGFAAALFGVVDGAYAAVQGFAVGFDKKFMPDKASLGLGIGLGVVGSLFLVGGIIKAAKPDLVKNLFKRAKKVDSAPASRSPSNAGKTFVPDDESSSSSKVVEVLGDKQPSSLSASRADPEVLKSSNLTETDTLNQPDKGPSGSAIPGQQVEVPAPKVLTESDQLAELMDDIALAMKKIEAKTTESMAKTYRLLGTAYFNMEMAQQYLNKTLVGSADDFLEVLNDAGDSLAAARGLRSAEPRGVPVHAFSGETRDKLVSVDTRLRKLIEGTGGEVKF